MSKPENLDVRLMGGRGRTFYGKGIWLFRFRLACKLHEGGLLSAAWHEKAFWPSICLHTKSPFPI